MASLGRGGAGGNNSKGLRDGVGGWARIGRGRPKSRAAGPFATSPRRKSVQGSEADKQTCPSSAATKSVMPRPNPSPDNDNLRAMLRCPPVPDSGPALQLDTRTCAPFVQCASPDNETVRARARKSETSLVAWSIPRLRDPGPVRHLPIHAPKANPNKTCDSPLQIQARIAHAHTHTRATPRSNLRGGPARGGDAQPGGPKSRRMGRREDVAKCAAFVSPPDDVFRCRPNDPVPDAPWE